VTRVSEAAGGAPASRAPARASERHYVITCVSMPSYTAAPAAQAPPGALPFPASQDRASVAASLRAAPRRRRAAGRREQGV